MSIISEKLYTPQEAAEALGVCRKTILRYIKRGRITAISWSRKCYKIKGKDILALKGEA